MRRVLIHLLAVMLCAAVASAPLVAATSAPTARDAKRAAKPKKLPVAPKRRAAYKRAQAKRFDPTAYLQQESAKDLARPDAKRLDATAAPGGAAGTRTPGLEVNHTVNCLPEAQLPCAPDDAACKESRSGGSVAAAESDADLADVERGSLPDGEQMAKQVLGKMRERCTPVGAKPKAITTSVGVSITEKQPGDSGGDFDLTKRISPSVGIKAQF